MAIRIRQLGDLAGAAGAGEPVYLTPDELRRLELGVTLSDAEWTRVFAAWMTYLGDQETATDGLFDVMSYWLALGLATCKEIAAYNRNAVGAYLWQDDIRNRLKKAGYSGISMPRMPRLFGNVKRGFDADGRLYVNVDLTTCLPNGYAGPDTPVNNCAEASSTSVVPRERPGLNAAPAAVPWGLMVLGAAIVATITTSIIAMMRNLPSSVRNQMRVDMANRAAEQDLKRAEYARNCFDKAFASLAAAKRTTAALQALKTQCDDAALKLIPDRPATELEEGWDLGKTVLYIGLGVAALAGGWALFRRSREGRGRNADADEED